MRQVSCDPASRGETWNFRQLTVDGVVTVDCRFGWDGVSVVPNCVGPLDRVRVTNASAIVTYYAHFRGRRGQPRRLDMPPGFVATYNTAQLTARGFQDNTDLDELIITRDPNPPGHWVP